MNPSIASSMPMPLPLDLITEVLCRLPVKSLLRFRCLSKPCCSLIDGPDFIKLHLNYSLKTNSNLSLIFRDCHLYSVEYDTLDTAAKLDHPIEDGGGTEVWGCCNGLLALFNSYDDVALWNHSTRKFQKLPATEIEFPREFCICQFIIYGLGYDPVSDDYKLVRIVQFFGRDDDSFDSEVKVYSLKSNSWRRIKDFPYYLRYKRTYGVLASNALHWVVTRKPESDTKNLVVAFDLQSEEYREVPQPDFVKMDFHMNVGVLGGCLCIADNDFRIRVDVWLMKEYGVKESWVKLFSVAQPQVISMFEFVRPLAYSKCGNKILLDQDGKKLIWFDLRSQTAESLEIQGIQGLSFFEVEMSVGSLVKFNNGVGAISRGKQQ